MYIKRKIEHDIINYLERKEILALVGPRQCGKTTTLKKIFKDINDERKNFITFEDQELLNLFEKNIKRFAELYVKPNKYLFIDEFQYAENGGKLLKYLYDLHKTKIIISGSSTTDLTVKAIKFLVGRIFILNMYTFDFYEYLMVKDKNLAGIYLKEKIDFNDIKRTGENLSDYEINNFVKYFEDFSIWGGYPEAVLADDIKIKEEVLKNIYNTYFLRDVSSMLGLIDDYKLGNLIKALALQIGNMVEYNELSRVSGLSSPTVKSYANFLSKTYIADFISPFYKNKRTEIVKNKKVFFFDNGLRNYVVKDFRPFDSRNDKGEILENAVWCQLLKNSYSANYWRDKNRNEIDFIVDIGESKILSLEVKYNQDKCKPFPQAFIKNYSNIKNYCLYLKPVNKKIGSNENIFIPLI